MIDRSHELPVARQAQVLKLSRSCVYYQARPVSAADLAIMRRMDELHLDYPFAGSRMLRDLLRGEGMAIGRAHVITLMKRMGVEAIYRRPNTSKPAPGHKIHPYLLRGLTVPAGAGPLTCTLSDGQPLARADPAKGTVVVEAKLLEPIRQSAEIHLPLPPDYGRTVVCYRFNFFRGSLCPSPSACPFLSRSPCWRLSRAARGVPATEAHPTAPGTARAQHRMQRAPRRTRASRSTLRRTPWTPW